MVHGPGSAWEIFDLRREVETAARKEKPAAAPAPAAAGAAPAPAAAGK